MAHSSFGGDIAYLLRLPPFCRDKPAPGSSKDMAFLCFPSPPQGLQLGQVVQELLAPLSRWGVTLQLAGGVGTGPKASTWHTWPAFISASVVHTY